MKTCPTFTATIYVGLLSEKSGVHIVQEVENICQDYCDEVGLCVTVTRTEFIYTGGHEPGVIVGLIKYPKFEPGYKPEELTAFALILAAKLLVQCGQKGVSVVFKDTTEYITETDATEVIEWAKEIVKDENQAS